MSGFYIDRMSFLKNWNNQADDNKLAALDRTLKETFDVLVYS